MNFKTESQHLVAPPNSKFPKLSAHSTVARLGLAIVALGLLLTVPCARGETKFSTADKDFILAAAQGGLTEVTLGELAARKGKRDDVREFGRLMVKDHAAINADLKALAAQQSVILPNSLDTEHQGMVDRMSKLTDAEFDDAYIGAMIADHKEDAKAFQTEATETTSAEMKRFVDKSQPVLDQHLKRITAMKK